MLRVTVELVPESNPQKKRTLRVLEISNVTDLALADSSDYHAVSLGDAPSKRREGVIRGHARFKWGPWKLIARAIHVLKLDLEDGG